MMTMNRTDAANATNPESCWNLSGVLAEPVSHFFFGQFAPRISLRLAKL